MGRAGPRREGERRCQGRQGPGGGGATGDTEAFAELLRGLKERSGLSYGSLAKRLHMSTSTLHRYCNGSAVPGSTRRSSGSPGCAARGRRNWSNCTGCGSWRTRRGRAKGGP
ncbi:helix-turn-helix transcriptional regulator [Streptomyces sp. M19]